MSARTNRRNGWVDRKQVSPSTPATRACPHWRRRVLPFSTRCSAWVFKLFLFPPVHLEVFRVVLAWRFVPSGTPPEQAGAKTTFLPFSFPLRGVIFTEPTAVGLCTASSPLFIPVESNRITPNSRPRNPPTHCRRMKLREMMSHYSIHYCCAYYQVQNIEVYSSCEIQDLIETNLCKLRI